MVQCLNGLLTGTRQVAVLAVALVITIGVVPATASDPESRAALEADATLPYSPVALLVQFHEGVPAATRANVRAGVGARLDRALPLVSGLERLLVDRGRVPDTVAALTRSPFVRYAEPDYVVRRTGEIVPDDTSFGSLWGLRNTGQSGGTIGADIRATHAWAVTTGDAAVTIAVIDSGIELVHPDLAANVWMNPGEAVNGMDSDGNGYVDDVNGWDFYSRDNDPTDTGGHGTHVSGTIAAVANNARGVAGVCWNCKVMALRFLGPNGGYTSDAILALNYAVEKGVRISNNSWGGGGYSTSLYNAISQAGAAGHVFVAAAGNDGVNADTTPMYPAAYNLPNIVSVAATTRTDGLASFSNYGTTSVDLGAPGASIYSTVLNGGYATYSGTSMAAPHVSGVFGLLLGLRPAWTSTDLIARVLQTVRPIGALAGKTVTGGVVNAAATVELPPEVPPQAPHTLQADALSANEIALSWTDDADDESGFEIERSAGGVASVVLVPVNTTTYRDAGLSASTTYSYRVRAFNHVGYSEWSALAMATTHESLPWVDIVASSEVRVAGSVSGDFTLTQARDGLLQAITEQSSGGPPRNRFSYLEHRWSFVIPTGSSVAVHANGHAPASSDGDVFFLEVSTDGGATFQRMFQLPGESHGSYQSFALPSATAGAVLVRVIDSNAAPGSTALDTVYIDHLFIRIGSGDVPPPDTPGSVQAAVQASPLAVTVSWTAADGAEHYVIARQVGNGAWVDAYATVTGGTAWSDANVAHDTTYGYRVQAANAGGSSEWSNVAAVTTPAAPPPAAIELSASARKVKGVAHVDLAWRHAAGAMVRVLRNGAVLTEVANTGAYTDATGLKGSATFTYQVCETTDGGACSAEVVVSF